MRYNVQIFDVLDSTNKYLEEMDVSSVEEGLVVRAACQTAGVGQKGNVWESDGYKNLTFSVLLKPIFLPIANRFMLTKVISLAMVDFLKQEISTETISIKWPNDIYVGKNKICGILISNKFRAGIYKTSIVGLGFNVNQTMFGSNIPNPTSLKIIKGTDYELSVVLDSIMYHILTRYDELKSGKILELDEKYRANLLYLGEEREYYYRDNLIRGTIKGVTEEGFLLLETFDNKSITCDLKELRFIH
jgi:BirA family biotin operon repressor/biotin-[acetyl-CoA-carboxylase] ligase